MTVQTIDSYEGAAVALRNPDLKQSLYDAGAVVMEGVLLTLHGEEHHKRRSLEFRVFRKNFFRRYEQEVFPKTLKETLDPYLAAGKLDLVEFGYRTTMNLTADFAGIDRSRRTIEETETLLRLVKKFSEGATLVHSKRNHDEVRQEVRAALSEFDTIFLQPSIERRLDLLEKFRTGNLAEDDLPQDVLTVLLRNEDKLELPDDLVRREMAFYLQAGSHSTGNSMTHAMHEIFQWCAAHPEDDARVKSDPLFLQRCVHESLRLHPASPVAWRQSLCPVHLASGHSLEAGEDLVIDLHSANRDTEIYGDDADRFNPHREIKKGYAPFGLTFGNGVHACLGRDLDGGAVPRAGTDPTTHQYGIVTMLVRALQDNGAHPDPHDPPTEDTQTERKNWARYPVLFEATP